jgi:hypothetical protein
MRALRLRGFRKSLIALTALLLAEAGCQTTNSCTPGTVLLSFTFSGAAVNVSALTLQTQLDGMLGQPFSVTRTPGRTTDSLALTFKRYIAGSYLTVTVTPLIGAGPPMAPISTTVTLGPYCTTLPIDIGSVGGADAGGGAAGAGPAGGNGAAASGGARASGSAGDGIGGVAGEGAGGLGGSNGGVAGMMAGSGGPGGVKAEGGSGGSGGAGIGTGVIAGNDGSVGGGRSVGPDAAVSTDGGADGVDGSNGGMGGMIAGSGGAGGSSPTPSLTWVSTEFLGRPTDQSVTVKAIATQALDAAVEYGTTSGVYAEATTTGSFPDGFAEVLVSGLMPDTGYFYRLLSRPSGSTGALVAGSEHTFHTQRARGQTFTFAVQADSHQGYPGFYDDTLYRTTMQNILAEQNDFLLDLGDTISNDEVTETAATVATKYVNQLTVFDLAAHSTPVFLVLGNHEREEGWYVDVAADIADSLPILNANARKQYFLNPEPDRFYAGNTDTSGNASFIAGDHLRGDYYAFEWGDALFVAIEPYWYTTQKPYAGTEGGDISNAVVGTRWDWTLGQQQYLWLQQTLQASSAKYKFVFAHHVAGGIDDYGRGGILGAKYCEWGGYDTDGTTLTFSTNRPGWAMPVHQLLVQSNVTAFFHAHDHVFAKESLDGIVYQEMPMAANANYDMGFATNPTDYAGAQMIANSGHLRVTVSPTNVTVDYVRSFLKGQGTNGTIATSYTMGAASP